VIDGTLWLNLGDSYANAGAQRGNSNLNALAATPPPFALAILSVTLFAVLAQEPPAPLSIPKAGSGHGRALCTTSNFTGRGSGTALRAGSPFLKMERVREPEQYNMSQAVAGRIGSIVNIHNPSIEFHAVERGLNTGAAIILVAGGGHNTLNVGSEGADFVPFFYNYGVNTIILRNRLRRDGYNPQTDAVKDALQSIRMVRAYAKQWNLDPTKIGIMGFSAGAELASAAAVSFDDFDKKTNAPGDPLAGISSRPDFVRPGLSRTHTLCKESHRACHSPQCASGLYRLCRIGRPRSRDLGHRVLLGDVGRRNSQC
jgi:hypothetical protein